MSDVIPQVFALIAMLAAPAQAAEQLAPKFSPSLQARVQHDSPVDIELARKFATAILSGSDSSIRHLADDQVYVIVGLRNPIQHYDIEMFRGQGVEGLISQKETLFSIVGKPEGISCNIKGLTALCISSYQTPDHALIFFVATRAGKVSDVTFTYLYPQSLQFDLGNKTNG